MSSIAGPCLLFHHGGVSKTSVRTGLQLKPCRGSGSIVEVTMTTMRLRVSAIAAQVAEDGDTNSVVGKETKLKEASPLSAKMVPNYESDEDDDDEVHEGSREVYMISDGPGWTADHAVQAALGQFENCFVDQRCSVDTHLFSQINEVGRLMEIIRQAAQEQALVFYTLADPYMAEAADKACEMLHVPHVNILGPITDALQSHLGVSPSGIPRGSPGRKSILSKQYFKRIEAVEFTIRQDDGVLPKNIIDADIVLTGVSRTSKTPLSTYLAQKGYKVANVPLVLGIDPPKELFEVNQDKVYGLTINPTDLKSIRISRSLTLGITGDGRTKYSDMEHIRKELEYSQQLFLKNPRWPVVEVTGKSIEETAAVILRIFHERRSKHLMPRISRRYAFRGEQDKYYENNNRTNLQLEAKALAGGVIALGKFDALHVGHRALAERAAELGEPFLVSFAGMAQVLGWEVRLPVVAPCDRTRVMGLWAKHCSDMVPREYMLEFAKVRSLSPEQFVAKLAFELKVKGVVAGANYRFGYKAAGDASDLVRLCQEHGLQSAIVNPVMDGVAVTDNAAAPVLGEENSCREKGQVSTTRVRKALANGDMKRVAELLGRNHRLVFQPGPQQQQQGM